MSYQPNPYKSNDRNDSAKKTIEHLSTHADIEEKTIDLVCTCLLQPRINEAHSSKFLVPNEIRDRYLDVALDYTYNITQQNSREVIEALRSFESLCVDLLSNYTGLGYKSDNPAAKYVIEDVLSMYESTLKEVQAGRSSLKDASKRIAETIGKARDLYNGLYLHNNDHPAKLVRKKEIATLKQIADESQLKDSEVARIIWDHIKQKP